MGRTYEPLTPQAKRLKQRLKPCVSYAAWIAELEEERQDIAGRGFAEEQELTARLCGLRREWEARRRAAADMISAADRLTSLERRILRLRYLCAEPWEGICARVCRESGPVFTAYRSALNKLAQLQEERLGA